MSRSVRIYVGLAVLIALSVLFLLGVVHTAAGASGLSPRKVAEGHRLAQAWCQSCHAVEPDMAGFFDLAPSFQAVADRKGTTALSLKVFWRTSHHDMPNLVIAPDQADALSEYILSLRGN
ncbi:cytochrome c [Bradyrhizobium sp. WYCCWR 13023]|uniref:Cytochrome c n=1 Tax=Bradyrhizobium zhengyangense TaxID=2911009 RepID=A0A9X1RHG6_9BRAD|nr:MULTISPECIES: cytochrome c [Bradyrhizobium]MCG2632111.1 cytochrome c [Bradyrhizobium zhengyangense]MCG2637687.1 cytochrome c [Bradyrhizobium zhengyangense]MCG2666083.1 cytochrome c [Bradyrhizobium zhengyangense]MDA9521116.1 cytochrome C [Bradyrhizobium sp. CCBAU 11434]